MTGMCVIDEGVSGLSFSAVRCVCVCVWERERVCKRGSAESF